MRASKSVLLALVAFAMAVLLVRVTMRAPDAAAESSAPSEEDGLEIDREGDLVILIEDDKDELHIISADADTFYEQLSVISDAASEGEILAIERDIKGASVSAIDPLRSSQYGLDLIGVDALPEDLDGSGLVVAVLDTGIRRTHEELDGRLLDGADCVHLLSEDEGCDESTSGSDGYYHGTHIAAGIVANRGNGVGIHGVAPGAMVLPVRVLDDVGEGWWSDIADGVLYAISQDVDVINMSLEGPAIPSIPTVLQVALQHARDAGIVVIVAAGNQGAKTNYPIYPASFDTTFSVTAIDPTSTVAGFASFGSWVDVAASGVNVMSAYYDPEFSPTDQAYAERSGTSMAAPQVAGLALLILQANPNLTVDEVEAILTGTALDLGDPGLDEHYGYGLVQAPSALGSAFNQIIYPGLAGEYSEGTTLLSWPSGEFVTGFEVIRDGIVVASLDGDVSGYFDTDVTNGRTYEYSLRVLYPLGSEVTVGVSVSAFDPSGYWMLGQAGTVYPFGDAGDFGNSSSGSQLAAIASNSDGSGYWLLSKNGTVQAFGSAVHFGDVLPGSLNPDESVAAISATTANDGYWVFTDRGRVIPFGAADFHGDMNGLILNGPVVASATTPSGLGYFMIGSDGGVFAFGDAEFAGSMGGVQLNEPVVGIAPDPDGTGYWLVATDGGIFAFGAGFHGSMGGTPLNAPVIGAVASGTGYLLVATDGGVFAFGGAKFDGSLGGEMIPAPIVGLAPR